MIIRNSNQEFDIILQLPHFIAHRGLSSQAPENTFAAFNLAAQKGFQMFECDAQLSKDEVPVIIHDDQVNRTTNRKGNVFEITYTVLETLDAGSWFEIKFQGEKIPSLKALLEWLVEHQIAMNLELKGRDGETQDNQRLAEVVANMLEPYREILKGRLLVSSFQFEALVKFKELENSFPLGVLIDKSQFNEIGLAGVKTRFQTLEAYSLNLDSRLITKARLPEFLKITENILVYTVTPARAERLFQQGIKGVFTNG